MKKFVLITFVIIVIVAAFLRLWQLGNVPPSPDWDEAALGYDAYSIIHTGRDEFGKFLPVVLRSFDDYKPALYAYLTIPSVYIFDLNLFSTRLPSALAGIATVIIVFFIVRQLFEDYRYRDYLSLGASFLFAISPWSIQFSRVAFESNVGVFLNATMVLLFLYSLKKPWILTLTAIFAGLGEYIYQSDRVFTPLLLLALVIIWRKKLLKLPKKYLITSFVIGIIVILPMAFYILSDKGSLLRVRGTSIFTYQTEILKNDVNAVARERANGDKIGLLLDNRRLVYAKTIVAGYLSHFDFNWLFIRGDISRHHAPNMGLIYLIEFPFILIGLYKLLFGEFDGKTKLTIFAWFLLAPLPAAITTGVPHAVRTLNFLPTWQIFSALGFVTVGIVLSNVKLKIFNLSLKYYFIGLLLVLFTFNFLYYLDQYFVQLNYYTSQDWQYGYKQAVSDATSLSDKYKEIVVSDNQPLDKSYMFFLFYLKYSPSDFQKIGENSSGSFVSHHHFGKYTFRPIDWSRDSLSHGVLYIGSPGEIPQDAPIIDTIRNLDGSVAIRVAGT